MAAISPLILSGQPITVDDFISVTLHHRPIELDPSVEVRIASNRDYVDTLVREERVVYGLTTGFGSLATKSVSQADTVQLQLNLIRSHAVGCGDPSPAHVVRGMMFLRLVSFVRGYSGVRYGTVQKLTECLNKNFVPLVPSQGSVGASGDLCPLSHMVVSMLGEGKAFDSESQTYRSAADILGQLGITPMTLSSKEGLALNNGTQFITSHLTHAIHHALRCIRLANLSAACAVEALRGTSKAFHPEIHRLRSHPGQIATATQIRTYLEGSEIDAAHGQKKVQDAYSLRCVPQIHGAAQDIISTVASMVTVELNSVTDNPLVITDGEEPIVISGGNFHGQPVAAAADMLALAMTYLCNASERRIERMVNSSLNGFLPDFLVPECGLNSGFMIVQYAAAAITAENRRLASPSSVHSIPTCNGTEDVVSMGADAARKAMMAVENLYKVLGYEFATASQALFYATEKPAPIVEEFIQGIRTHLPYIESDRYMSEEINAIISHLHTCEIP